MVFFQKSYPAPEIKKDYRTQSIIDRLEQDFCNKCYLCEEKAQKDINVEHFIPHKEDETLKYNWDNLFLSCGHCNNIKLAKYDNILDCTKEDSKVDEVIEYRIKPFPKEKVDLTTISDDEKVLNTLELLDKIYNATNTPLKRLESANLRDKLLNEILEFQTLLFEYNSDNEKLKEKALVNIEYELSNKSAFTAFKRWIVRDSQYFRDEFKDLI